MNYNKFLEHKKCFGLHIEEIDNGDLELRCFDRVHGGDDPLLLTIKNSNQPEPMPKIAEEKLVLQWKESKMIGGDPVYYLDDSHAVVVKNYIDQIELWFFERTFENGKYYCRVTKKHLLDAKKIKEDYEILLSI